MFSQDSQPKLKMKDSTGTTDESFAQKDEPDTSAREQQDDADVQRSQ